MYLWWKHTPEEEVSFEKPSCSLYLERKETVTAPGSFLVIFLHYQYTSLNVTKITLVPSKLIVIKAFLKCIVQLKDIGETESRII